MLNQYFNMPISPAERLKSCFSLGTVIFFADYCFMTSLQRYLVVCGVVILEEFEKFEFSKWPPFFVAKILKPF